MHHYRTRKFSLSPRTLTGGKMTTEKLGEFLQQQKENPLFTEWKKKKEEELDRLIPNRHELQQKEDERWAMEEQLRDMKYINNRFRAFQSGLWWKNMLHKSMEQKLISAVMKVYNIVKPLVDIGASIILPGIGSTITSLAMVPFEMVMKQDNIPFDQRIVEEIYNLQNNYRKIWTRLKPEVQQKYINIGFKPYGEVGNYKGENRTWNVGKDAHGTME